jgi:hypothetical protein
MSKYSGGEGLTIQYRQKTGMSAYGRTTPLKRPNMTKKKGRTFEMTVKEGAKAQIHWPQEEITDGR